MGKYNVLNILHEMRTYGVTIYGAGSRGNRAYEILTENGYYIKHIIDKCEEKKLGGMSVKKISEFTGRDDSVCVITPLLDINEYEKIRMELDKIFFISVDMRLIDWLESGIPKNDGVINYCMSRPFNHYESPFPNRMEYECSLKWAEMPCDVELNIERQLSFAKHIGKCTNEYRKKYNKEFRFQSNNMFDAGEAMVYHSMIRYFCPKRITEIGSGYSTAVALDTIEFWNDCKSIIYCIEPYPSRLFRILKRDDNKRMELHKCFLQNVSLTSFEELEENDILFIDSSHVSKSGGDVVMEYLQILPRLKPGVVIHIHDIFYPFCYPAEWIAEGRPYNEAFILQAFLMGNNDYEILFWEDYFEKHHTDEWKENCGGDLPGGSSFWMRKIR
ncbi:class I SAM-dependent methyltransferase [Selenomonas ruminantium]|jgi:hypothetical protein|nr:class I SAM-dependent methyltransferase [Selenomonas ruminantium]